MGKLIILDFSMTDVDIYPIEYDSKSDIDELIESLGHNVNNCQWMIASGNITFHKEVLK